MMNRQPNDDRTDQTSRRSFLKSSAAAAVTGGILLNRSVHAAGSGTIKIGLVGCGGRGSGAAVNAMNAGTHIKLVAMADIFERQLQNSLKNLTQAKPDQVQVDKDHQFVGFDGYQKVIDSGIDVILIACASRYHPDYLAAAIKAGKHVFVEKPHALDVPHIKKVIAACDEARKKNLCVVSGLCWRYDTGVRETMKRVMDGAIGDMVTIQENYMRSPYHLTEPEPGLSEIQYQFRNWYHFNWLCGDDIAQSLIHSMDKGAWAMHDEPPVSAYGIGGRASSQGRVYGDVFDHFSIVYEYANGVRLYGVGRAQVPCFNDTSDTFFGTKGICHVIKHRIEGETNWRFEGKKKSMYDLEHEALFRAVESGNPINNGPYMVNSTMLAILGRMVAYTGKKITWDEAMQSTYRLGPDNPDFQTDPPVKPDADGIYPVPIPGITQQA